MANALHWADYLVFGATLLFSVLIGIYFAARERRSSGNKTEQYLLAGRKMPVPLVSVSIFVTWLSANGFIVDPMEVYYHGAVYIYLVIGAVFACPVVAHFFAPFYHKLNITSVYEFLEVRYHVALRYISCVAVFIGAAMILGIVLYGPSAAMSQVTGTPVWLSILAMGVVGTFYSTLGGMKAILWVDMFQSLIMLGGTVCLLLVGTNKAGGFVQVFKVASKHSRLNLFKVQGSPLVRSTVWSYFLGGFFRFLVHFISGQFIVQRYCTLSSASDASRALYLTIPMFLGLAMVITGTGLVMFAYYTGCDPLLAGRMSSPEQIVPLFMMDVLGFIPGVPGLFIAAICAASLSTFSSILNGISANILVDIIIPLHKYFGNNNSIQMKDTLKLYLAKLISVCTGALATGIAFAVLYMKADIFAMTVKLTGVFASPISALFFMGRICPFVDAASASIGVLGGLACSTWWGLGAMFYPPPSQALPVTSDMCDVITGNSTLVNMSDIVSPSPAYSMIRKKFTNESLQQNSTTMQFGLTDMYGLSPVLFTPLGFLTSILITFVASFIRECCKRLRFTADSGEEYYMAGSMRSEQEQFEI